MARIKPITKPGVCIKHGCNLHHKNEANLDSKSFCPMCKTEGNKSTTL